MKVKRAGVGTKILILVLMVVCVTALLSMHTKLTDARAMRDRKQAQVQVLEERINELKDAIAHSDDPEYIMNYAQKEGGMVEPDSIRFVDTSK